MTFSITYTCTQRTFLYSLKFFIHLASDDKFLFCYCRSKFVVNFFFSVIEVVSLSFFIHSLTSLNWSAVKLLKCTNAHLHTQTRTHTYTYTQNTDSLILKKIPAQHLIKDILSVFWDMKGPNTIAIR